MSNSEKLGEKVRLIREKNELTVQQLAEKTGEKKEFIEDIEKGRFIPPMGPLIKLAKVLGVRLGTFLDDQEDPGPVITKKNCGNSFKENEYGNFFSLAMNKLSRQMDPLLVDLFPTKAKNKRISHEGEEFVFVIEGDVTIEYGKETYNLHAGDSIYYDCIVEHDIRADKCPAKILTVSQEPL